MFLLLRLKGRMEHFDCRLFITALGLAFLMEGLAYFLFAEKMPPMLRLLSELPARTLRLIGLAAVLAGLLFIFLARVFHPF